MDLAPKNRNQEFHSHRLDLCSQPSSSKSLVEWELDFYEDPAFNKSDAAKYLTFCIKF